MSTGDLVDRFSRQLAGARTRRDALKILAGTVGSLWLQACGTTPTEPSRSVNPGELDQPVAPGSAGSVRAASEQRRVAGELADEAVETSSAPGIEDIQPAEDPSISISLRCPKSNPKKCGRKCIPARATCCNATTAFWCAAGKSCCGNKCCNAGTKCCGNTCIPTTATCCNPTTSKWCARGQKCCGTGCIPAANPCGGCPSGQKKCGTTCISNADDCCSTKDWCKASRCCGVTACCKPGSHCCSAGDTCCPQGYPYRCDRYCYSTIAGARSDCGDRYEVCHGV